MESALLRTMKFAASRGEGACVFPVAMTRLYLSRGIERIESAARKIIAAVAEGDMLRTQLAILRRLAKHEPYNVVAIQQQVAQAVLDKGKYAAQ
jgi:hypothetical protein